MTPPSGRTPRDPGYIRAYPWVCGKMAAAWLGLAHARLASGDEVHRIFDLINPICRTDDLIGAELYRAEPYVVPADVRGAEPPGSVRPAGRGIKPADASNPAAGRLVALVLRDPLDLRRVADRQMVVMRDEESRAALDPNQ